MRNELKRFFKVAAVILALVLGIQLPLLRDLHITWSGLMGPGAAWILGPLLFVAANGVLYLRMQSFQRETVLPDWQVYTLFYPYFLWFCTCVYYAFLQAAIWLVLGLFDLAFGGIVKIEAEPGFAWAQFGLAAILSIYGIGLRRFMVKAVPVTIPVRGLGKGFDGLRIAQISDIHLCEFTRAWFVERSVARINALQPDVTFVTGDLIASGPSYAGEIVRILGGLRAPLGVFASMGNHDYFSGIGDTIVSGLSGAGVRVLRNSGMVLEREGARLFIGGVDDTWTRLANPAKTMAARPDGVPAVVMAHDPLLFPHLAALGADLVVSGHTHGGQATLPGLARWFSLARIVSRYVLGYYELDGAQLYVNGGLGTTGVPIRAGVPPEITLYTLRAVPRGG